MILPPKAGRVCSNSLRWRSMDSPVQSAVSPASSFVATAPARSRPKPVAPINTISGRYLPIRYHRLQIRPGPVAGQHRFVDHVNLVGAVAESLLGQVRMSAPRRRPKLHAKSPAKVRPAPKSSQETGWASPWSCSTNTHTPLRVPGTRRGRGRNLRCDGCPPASFSRRFPSLGCHSFSKAPDRANLHALGAADAGCLEIDHRLTACSFITMASVGHASRQRSPHAMHLPSMSHALPRGFFFLPSLVFHQHPRIRLSVGNRQCPTDEPLQQHGPTPAPADSPSPCTISPLARSGARSSSPGWESPAIRSCRARASIHRWSSPAGARRPPPAFPEPSDSEEC